MDEEFDECARWLCLTCKFAKYLLERDPLSPDYDYYAHFLTFCTNPHFLEMSPVPTIDGPYCGRTVECEEYIQKAE